MKKFIASFGLFLLLSSLFPHAPVRADGLNYEDLNNWSATGGNWQVQPGGRTVYQSVNGGAVYFLSPTENVIDRTIQGTIKVDEAQNDDDFIGFTFGYQDQQNNYVFAWDKGGWGISGYGKELWKMEGGVKTNLASDLSVDSSKGWENGVTYDFRILYMSNKIRVSINGEMIFDLDGMFPAGKFGFFNESQGNVTYGNVQSAPGSLTEVPPVVSDDSYGMDKNTTLTKDSAGGVFANDYDPNLDTFTASLVQNVAHGTLNFNTADGSFSYTPEADWIGNDAFTYKLTDNDGDSEIATVSIAVSEPNVAPTNIILSKDNFKVGLANGETIGTFTTEDANTNESFDYILLDNSGGRFGIDENKLLVANSSALPLGDYSVQVRSTDLRGLFFNKTFTIHVVPNNEAPTDITLQNQLAIEDISEDGTQIGTFSVTDPDEGDTHSLSLTSDAGGAFELVETNKLVVADNTKLNPPEQTVTVLATDEIGATFSKSFTITVNSAPAEIQSLSVSSTEPDNVQISWEDNKSDASHLDYGLNTSYSETKPNANQSASLELAQCVSYNYRVRAEKNGETILGADKVLTTEGCVGDAEVLNQSKLDMQTTGGKVELVESEEKVELIVPEGVSEANPNIQFQMKKLEPTAVLTETSLPNESVFAINDKVFDFKALTGVKSLVSEFTKNIVVRLNYTDEDIQGLDEDSLRIYRWHDAQWEMLENCSVDQGENVITCTTNKFSVFGLFGSLPKESLDNGKSKTLRWKGMQRGDFSSAATQKVNRYNFEEYYARSKAEVARLNEGFAGKVVYRTNAWGEKVFLTYLSGRVELARFRHRFQNLIAFSQRVFDKLSTSSGDSDMHASAPTLAAKYEEMKQTYQREPEVFHSVASDPKWKVRKPLSQDQIASHKAQRKHIEKNPMLIHRHKRKMSNSYRSSRIRGKNMDVVRMTINGRSFPMSEYLENSKK